MCQRLNKLIQRGVVKSDRILYCFLNDVTQSLEIPNHEWSPLTIEFLNTVQFLGGERTAEFWKGPMWYGTGHGGIKNLTDVKLNLGGPSRTTRH